MPIIYCITNEVSANFVANALLAVGASPIMSSALEEVDDLCALADALVLNIGTPSQSQFETMLAAGKRMHALGKPIVLDPVGVNATHYRLEMAQTLIREVHPTVIRGNASEVLALATNTVLGTGLDTPLHTIPSSAHSTLHTPHSTLALRAHTSSPSGGGLVGAADALARQTEAVIVVSGPEDYITDGTKTASVRLGSPAMAKTTGTGCVASAVIAAYLSPLTSRRFAPSSHLSPPPSGGGLVGATIKAMTLMGQAGEDMSHFLERLSTFNSLT